MAHSKYPLLAENLKVEFLDFSHRTESPCSAQYSSHYEHDSNLHGFDRNCSFGDVGFFFLWKWQALENRFSRTKNLGNKLIKSWFPYRDYISPWKNGATNNICIREKGLRYRETTFQDVDSSSLKNWSSLVKFGPPKFQRWRYALKDLHS